MSRDDLRRRLGRLSALALAVALVSACSAALKNPGMARSARTTRHAAVAAGTPTPSPSMTPTPDWGLEATATPHVIPTLEKLPVPTFEDLLRTPLPAATLPPDRPAPVPTAPAPIAIQSGAARLERRGDLWTVRPQLGARPLGDFLLDTGAGATFIDQRLADELRLPEIIPAGDGGPATTEAGIRELRGLTVDGLAIETTPTFAVDLTHTEELIGVALAGVAGFPVLGSAPFTIDFKAGTWTIHHELGFEPPPGVDDQALRIDQGLPFVEATLENGSPVWLLLDTTAPAAITVWRGFAKQHTGMLHEPPKTAPGANGAVGEPELHALRILGVEYPKIAVVIQDPPARPWQRARVVGRVGMGLLRDLRLTVQPATERMWVER